MRAVIIPIIVVGAAVALLFATETQWDRWTSQRRDQRTDDAFVRADMTPLSTRISGTVRAVDVNDYQAVKPGQLLVQLDDADYRAALEEARAALAGSEAQLAGNQAAKLVEDATIQGAGTGVSQGLAAVSAAQAGVASVQPGLAQAELERKRQEALLASAATTRQQEEAAVAAAGRLTGSLASSEAGLAEAQAALASSRAQLEAAKQQRAALDVKDRLYQADIEAKRAAIILAQVNLSYTRILAPAAGYVGERHVLPGQLVAVGMEIIDLVQSEDWIQANFKETQLANIRIGAAADVRVDAFAGTVFHGKVAEISPASGSQFALLPPDNATGNFTKVVQRVPVKILLDPGQDPEQKLRPGFSAIVTIHTPRSSSSHGSNAEGNHS